MTKREFLDTVFALAPNEANKIMDAFDEYVESNEPHWIPCGKCIHADGKHRRCKILGRSINEDYFCYWAEPFKGVTT